MSRDSAYLNSCELILEDLEINYSGNLYLLWRKGKRHTSSRKWEIEPNQPIILRQKMELNLKLYKDGDILQPKNTHLYILNDDDDQIANFLLPVHTWGTTPKKIQLKIKKDKTNLGVLTVRVKRKQIMQLDNFNKFSAEYEDSSGQQQNQKLSMAANIDNVSASQIYRLRNQLDDANFLNQKLRKDRTEALTRNDMLDRQLRDLKSKIGKQMIRLEQYYQKKMEVHAQIYKQEIQNLISTFNENSVTNKKIMKSLIEQNEGLQADKIDLQRISEQQLNRQQEHYENKLYEVEQKNLQLSSQRAALQDQLSTSVKENKDLGNKLQGLRIELEELTRKYEREKVDFEKMVDLMNEQKAELEDNIRQLKKERAENRITIEEQTEQIENCNQKISEYEKSVQQLQINLDDEKAKVVRLQTQLEQKVMDIEKLTFELDNLKTEKQHLTEYNERLINDMNKKEDEHRNQLILQQNNNSERIDGMDKQIVEINERYMESDRNNHDLQLKIQDLELQLQLEKSNVEQLNNTVLIYEEQKKQLDEEVDNLRKQLDQALFINEKNTLDIQQRDLDLEELKRANQMLDQEIEKGRESLKESFEEIIKEKDQQIKELEERYDRMQLERHQIMNVHDTQIGNFRAELDKVNDQNLDYFKQVGQYQLNINRLDMEVKQYKDLLDQTREQMREKDRTYQETLKMFYQQNAFNNPMKAYEDMIKKVEGEDKKKKKKKLAQDIGSPQVSQIEDEEDHRNVGHMVIRIPSSNDELESEEIPKMKKPPLPKKKMVSDSQYDEYVRQQMSQEEKKMIEKRLREQLREQLQDEVRDDVEKKIRKQLQKKFQNEFAKKMNEELMKQSKKFTDELKESLDQDNQMMIEDHQKHLQQIKSSEEHLRQIRSSEELYMEEINVLRQENLQLTDQIAHLHDKEEKYLTQISDLARDIGDFQVLVEDLKIQLDHYRNLAISSGTELIRSASEERINQFQKKRQSRARQIQISLTELGSLQKIKKCCEAQVQCQLLVQQATPPATQIIYKQVPAKSDPSAKRSEREEYLQKKNEQLEKERRDIMDDLRRKQWEIEKLQSRNKQLFEEVTNIKNQLGLKISMHESKLAEFNKLEMEYSELSKKEESDLKKIKQNLAQKESQMKEKKHQYQLQKSKLVYENERLKEEIKRMKEDIAEFEKNNKRNFGNDQHAKLLQDQLQQSNKRILDLTRQINQVKIERESLQDQNRILRKKNSDFEKSEKNIQQKYLSQQQELEDIRRKYNRAKRELEDRDQEVGKLKQQNKRVQEQMSRFNSYSSQTILDRKKNMEQKFELEQNLTKKDAEIKKLQKDLDNFKKKHEQEENNKKEKKAGQAREIDTLTMDLQRNIKALKMSEEENQSLRSQIDTMQLENNRRIQQNSLIYSDKLKLYVREIANIKGVLDETVEEMRQVRSENSVLVQELERLKHAYEQLAIREKEILDVSQQYKGHVEQLQNSEKQLKKKCDLLERDSISLHNMISELQEQLSKERGISMKKSEKVEQYEILSEKYLYELKNLKVRISDYENKEDITSNLTNRIHVLEDDNLKLTEQLMQATRQFQKYKSIYMYTESQINQLVSQLEKTADENKREEMRKLIEDMNKESQAKNVKLQKQVLQLYNDNARLGSTIQQKDDEYAEMMGRISEIEPYVKKYSNLKEDMEVLEEEMKMLRQQNIEDTNMVQRADLKLKQLERQNNSLAHQLEMVTIALTNQTTKSNRTEEELREIQTAYRLNKQQLHKIQLTRGEKTDNLISQIQTAENKLLGAELENARIRERQEKMHRQYKQQVKKMEIKMKEMSDAMKKMAKEMEEDFNKKMVEKEKLIKNLTNQRNSANESAKNYQNQSEAAIKECEELATELAGTRAQLSQDEDLYIQEINKLKANLKDMEQVYNLNLNNMEEQLAQLNRQLTQQKLNNRRNQSLKNSRLRQSQVDRRYEQRMRNKDLKIEELKNNVYLLQETVMNMKKKYEVGSQFSEKGSNGGKYKELYQDLVAQFERESTKIEEQRVKMEQNQRQMKRQMQKSIQNQQNLNLKLDHKNLELQSLKCQLKTVRELYQALQRQIDKRKLKLSEDIQSHTLFQKDLEFKNTKIHQLEQKISDLSSEIESLSVKMRKKQEQLNVVSEMLENEQHANKKIKNLSSETKTMQEINRRQNQALKEEIKRLQNENKRLSQQIQGLKFDLSCQKAKYSQSLRHEKKLERDKGQMEDLIRELEQQAGKFTNINERCIQNHGVTAEELVIGGFIDEKLFDQEQEINRLSEELEEMKFNQDRRMIDVEELRRINFQLQLKMEDYDFMGQQVDGLRKICDKLEEEKKIAVFREEAIRIRLSNLIDGRDKRDAINSQFLDGIEAILTSNYDIYA